MPTIDYPTILTPRCADFLFPTDENQKPGPQDPQAFVMAAEAILLLEEGPAALPITIVTQSLDHPVITVPTDDPDAEHMVCAIATDAAGRQVRFICWV